MGQDFRLGGWSGFGAERAGLSADRMGCRRVLLWFETRRCTGTTVVRPNPDHKRQGRYADPLGATESRGLQAAAVVKQNDFLKGYIVRLQNQLEEYLGAHAPLSEAVRSPPTDN